MEKRFCDKCGSPLDINTGLCPKCSAAENNAFSGAIPPQQPMHTEQKKSKAPIIIAVIAGVIVIAMIAGIVALAFGKGWIGGKKKTDAKATYAAYLRDDLVDKYGKFDADNIEESEGVCSVVLNDFSGNNKDDMIVVRAEQRNGRTVFNLTDYSLDDDGNDVEDTDNTVTLSNIDDEKMVVEDMRSEENILYFVEYEGTKYIISESMWWLDSYDYECNVFTINDGELTEVANLYVPAIGTDGTCISYSTLPPESMKVDDSDFDATDYEGTKLKDIYCPDGNVFFYQEGGGSDYKYDSHFDSIDSSVSAFFKCFGIDKSSCATYVEYDPDGRYIQLNRPEGVTYIYTYYCVVKYDYDTDERSEITEFIDYSDWESILQDENATATQPKEDEPDIAKLVKEANYFAGMWSFNPKFKTDSSKTVREKTESYDTECVLVTEPGINSKEDIKKLGRKYFTDDVLDELLSHNVWVEKDGKLYFSCMVQGEMEESECESKQTVVIESSTSNNYKLKVIDYYDGRVTGTLNEANLKKNGKNWIFDGYLWCYTNTEITVIKESDPSHAEYEQYFAYLDKVINGYGPEEGEDSVENPEWYIVDIDGDSVKELVVKDGTCEADYMFDFYTFKNGSIVYLGDCGGGHAGLGASDDGKAYIIYGHMGYGGLMSLSVSNGKIQTKSVIDGVDFDELDEKQKELGIETVTYHFKIDWDTDYIDYNIYNDMATELKIQ